MRSEEMLPILGMFVAAGLKPPKQVEDDPVSAAALYARILTRAGATGPEALAAGEQYLAEPTSRGYPKPWPDPGCLTARIPRLVAVAALGSDADVDRAWSVALRAAPLDASNFPGWARLMDGDEDAGNALGHALRDVGGLYRIKNGSADDIDRMRRAFVPEYRQRREAQRHDPDAVARIEARVARPALEDRRGR